jgi:hypothetical protein
MKRTATMHYHPWQDAGKTLTIRMAWPADGAALSRLAQLDSAPAPKPVPTLVAEVGGELRAALPLDGGRAIADPFRPTADLVSILMERARQFAPPPARRAAGRWRPVRALRSAPLPRA